MKKESYCMLQLLTLSKYWIPKYYKGTKIDKVPTLGRKCWEILNKGGHR